MKTPKTARPAALALLGVFVALVVSANGIPAIVPDALRDVPGAAGLRFTVTGNAGDLVPGLWRLVPVQVSNPGPLPIRVTGLSLGVASDTAPARLAATNLEIRQPAVSQDHMLEVPARATVTLPSQGLRTAAIRLRDLPTVNQDGCKDWSFALTWSGTAQL